MSIKIVFIKQSKDDIEGTLYIRTIENRRARKKSLKLRLSEKEFTKYFNQEKQKFRNNKKFTKAEYFNQIISEKLKEYSDFENNTEQIADKKKSFLKYWKRKINNTTNHGSRKKHRIILSKLIKFLNARDKEDLLFSEITPLLLDDLQYYFNTSRDPKKLNSNSAAHYLKVIKSIINKARKDDYFYFNKDPFRSFTFSKKPVDKKILNEEELKNLIRTNIKEPHLNLYRNMFLFQIFSNGMRVSDLLLLKINNFKKGRLKYQMYKTGTYIDMPLNLNLALFISELSKSMPQYQDIKNSEKIEFRHENEYHEVKLFSLRKIIEKLKSSKITYNPLVNLYIDKQNEKLEDNIGNMIIYKGHKILDDDKNIKKFIDLEHNLLNKIDKKFIEAISKTLESISQSNGNEFLFPILSSKDFGNFKNKDLSESQDKALNSSIIVYNRRLKKVQKKCSIKTNITSHMARHIYTNLLLKMDGVNLYDVSQSLGHANIKITEEYLSSGFNTEKLDTLNVGLSKIYRKS